MGNRNKKSYCPLLIFFYNLAGKKRLFCNSGILYIDARAARHIIVVAPTTLSGRFVVY